MPKKLLVDTNIFIDYLRGKEQTADFFRQTEKEKSSVESSEIVAAELYFGCLNDDEIGKIDEMFLLATAVSLNRDIFVNANLLKRKYDKGRSLGLPDMLIAATCWQEELTLVTQNSKDFEFIKEINLLKPY